jgi:NAD(P)-dependent dehydrogenase (short-subunit alcohol dehydrogenase family)
VGDAVERFGRLDVLHNNAATLGRRTLGSDTLITEATEDMVDETLRVNLKGVIWGCKYAIPAMVAVGGGSIINTSSVLAQRADSQRAVYAASKAGVEAVTRCVAAQFGRQGIRCNAVAPGFVVSPAISRRWLASSPRMQRATSRDRSSRWTPATPWRPLGPSSRDR